MAVKPVLVIMAAGMGSRYGGLKQIDPIDPYGNIIIDFSIYDAVEAGFEKIVCIIKKEMEEDFKECIGSRISKYIEIEYAYQELDTLPEGFTVPKERTKPWGTGHAILNCRDKVNGPFAVINADDYYGKMAFHMIYQELIHLADDEKYNYTMVGYELYKTLTDYGHVARGVCTIDEKGYLVDIKERTKIEKRKDLAYFTEDGGKTYTQLSEDTVVSMNMWGFTPSIFEELYLGFTEFLKKELISNPLSCEYFLPSVVGSLLEDREASVKVLNSGENWYGVTYKEDKKMVEDAIRKMKAKGIYPEKLWEDR